MITTPITTFHDYLPFSIIGSIIVAGLTAAATYLCIGKTKRYEDIRRNMKRTAITGGCIIAIMITFGTIMHVRQPTSVDAGNMNRIKVSTLEAKLHDAYGIEMISVHHSPLDPGTNSSDTTLYDVEGRAADGETKHYLVTLTWKDQGQMAVQDATSAYLTPKE